MTELTDFSDSEIYEEYERRVATVADELADILNDTQQHNSIDGREWCEENDVPESVFADAVDYFLTDVTWGVSPMYPMRVRDGEVENLYEEVEEEQFDSEVTEE